MKPLFYTFHPEAGYAYIAGEKIGKFDEIMDTRSPVSLDDLDVEGPLEIVRKNTPRAKKNAVGDLVVTGPSTLLLVMGGKGEAVKEHLRGGGSFKAVETTEGPGLIFLPPAIECIISSRPRSFEESVRKPAILSVSYVFDEEASAGRYVFYDPRYAHTVFATGAFVSLVEDLGLRGIYFEEVPIS